MFLPATRSSAAVERALQVIAREVPGRDRLRQIRRAFLDLLRLKGELDGTNRPMVVRDVRGGGGGFAAVRERGAVFSRASAARDSVAQERALLSVRHDLLMAWIADGVATGPRALLLVNDGWDLDPRDFYLVGAPVDITFAQELGATIGSDASGSATAALARTLAAAGWVSIAVASGSLGREEQVSFATCRRFVARSGVPVYLLLMSEPDPSTRNATAAAAGRAEELVAPSGGRVLRLDGAASLGATYRAVQDELRRQYVLTFYPPPRDSGQREGEGDWRRVTVEVTRPGHVARSAGGYVP